MKYIQKGLEPKELTEWKALENENWQPVYDSMEKSLKNIVKDSLSKEQGALCCYCERRILPEDSHIEHFVPLSNDDIDPLDYSNMLCSCQNRLKKGEPRHCGNSKGNWFDVDLLISPLDPDCENRFLYIEDGRVRPSEAEDRAAAITIEKLGLDINKLNAMRRKAIEPFIDDALSDEDLREFVIKYLQPDSEGILGEFYMTVKSLFGIYLEQ